MCVEEGAAIRGVFVDEATALEQPVTVAVRLPRGHERREGLVGHGAEMLFRPGEDVLARGTQTFQIGDIETAGDMPARGSAELAGALRPSEAELLALRQSFAIWM